MIQDEDKYLQQTLNNANLKELFPEFNREAEWAQLSGKMKERSIPAYRWARAAAAILLVVAGISGYWMFKGSNHEGSDQHNNTVAAITQPKVEPTVKTTLPDTVAVPKHQPVAAVLPAAPVAKTKKTVFYTSKPSQSISAMALATGAYGKSTEAICNATKCAIEICISQTVKCKDKAPAEVADCRTLEPDQAGPLKYTDPERYGCKVTVDEIRIKKVSTGETIVINSTTQPASAEEMLQCFTGERKCDVMAGFFDSDCNNENTPRKITIDSHHGNVNIE